MMSLVLGGLTVFAGVWGILHWPADFLSVLKGIVPLCFICGGGVAILAGIISLRK